MVVELQDDDIDVFSEESQIKQIQLEESLQRCEGCS